MEKWERRFVVYAQVMEEIITQMFWAKAMRNAAYVISKPSQQGLESIFHFEKLGGREEYET